MSKMIFDAHACRHLADGVSVLRADTRVDCATDSYRVIQLVGWFMGVCWVFGVPFYWLVSLQRNKKAIQNEKAIKKNKEAIQKAIQFIHAIQNEEAIAIAKLSRLFIEEQAAK